MFAQNLGSTRHRHTCHQHGERLRLEQRREMTRVALPGDPHRVDSAVGAVDSWDVAVDDRLILPDIEMAPRLGSSVIDPMASAALWTQNGVSGRTLQIDMELVLAVLDRFELRIDKGPLRAEVHRFFQQCGKHRGALVHTSTPLERVSIGSLNHTACIR